MKKEIVNAVLKILFWNILQKSMQFKKILYGAEDKVNLSASSVISTNLKSRALKVLTFKDVNRAGSKLSRRVQQHSCQLFWKQTERDVDILPTADEVE